MFGDHPGGQRTDFRGGFDAPRPDHKRLLERHLRERSRPAVLSVELGRGIPLPPPVVVMQNRRQQLLVRVGRDLPRRRRDAVPQTARSTAGRQLTADPGVLRL